MADEIITSNQTDTKTCSKCGEVKPLASFAKDRKYIRGQCKQCCLDYWRQYRITPPPKRPPRMSPEERRIKNHGWARKTRLKYTYNLTEEEYDAMLKAQNGVCAICGSPETWKNQYGKVCRLSVEHDHTTGKVRGLVCNGCNSLVSLLENNPRIPMVQMYLENHSEAAKSAI